jgi:hypothetical protein
MTAARMTRTADGLSYRVTFPFDRIVVDAIKADVPAHSRTYDPDEKAWYIAVAYQRIIRQLLEAVFIEVEMDSERRSTCTPPPSDRAPRTEYTVLHLLPSAPPELVESAYKCLSRMHHPDAGGTTTTMQELNSAVATIRRKRGA